MGLFDGIKVGDLVVVRYSGVPSHESMWIRRVSIVKENKVNTVLTVEGQKFYAANGSQVDSKYSRVHLQPLTPEAAQEVSRQRQARNLMVAVALIDPAKMMTLSPETAQALQGLLEQIKKGTK